MATAARISKPTTGKRLAKRKAWSALKVHYRKIGERHLRDLFEDDPERAEKFTVEAVGINFDYSKNRITEKTLGLLLELAEESGLRERIDAMFRGDKINITENRAVLHVALRAPKDATIVVDGKNVVPEVHAVLDKMSNFSNRVRSAETLQRTQHDLPFRFQRRWHGLCRGGGRSRSLRNAFYRFLKNLHHARNHDQCTQRP